MRWSSIWIATRILVITAALGMTLPRPATAQTPAPPRAVAIVGTSIQVQWDANAEGDLAGYKLYWGTQSGKYGTPVDVGNVTTWALGNLATGTYYIAVTAYNSAGQESGFSNEVSATMTPQAITQLGVTYLTATTAAIAWVTRTECSGVISWGTTISLGRSMVANNLGTTDHMALLSGLPARTHLFYQVTGVCSGSPISSEIHTFNSK